MFHSDKELFQHIFDEIDFLTTEVRSLSKGLFLEDTKSQGPSLGALR